ncbi:MAG TPA: hypothetical protein K8V15_11035 [Tessaracoccus flavescens]|uniref:Uncharacterized protein n=1 Tax=Tessaracoccus flavescens TaxID=399497 RepID=A0A921EQ05_9ACTN|nr:hypothetical protein [Tessaracoccus flavescens]
MSHDNLDPQRPSHARNEPKRRDLTPFILVGVVILIALVSLIVYLLMRGQDSAEPAPTTSVTAASQAPSGEDSASAQPEPSAPVTQSEGSEPATSTQTASGGASEPAAPATETASEPPAEEEPILEPGELPVTALPRTIGEFELSDFQGLYAYRKAGAEPNTGVSVTDVGDEFYPDELLASIPGAEPVANGLGVCGDGDTGPLCYVGLTEFGSVVLNALDPNTTLQDVQLIAEEIVATVG